MESEIEAIFLSLTEHSEVSKISIRIGPNFERVGIGQIMKKAIGNRKMDKHIRICTTNSLCQRGGHLRWFECLVQIQYWTVVESI